ncbi:MAG: hypothetical protein A2Y07_00850 [Planctomycetes bacterium GWF2_50_10]|nr:MAG: hypothetical protein A2Y07_00850 [Planctomycetes bacterium GWF2_50_10]
MTSESAFSKLTIDQFLAKANSSDPVPGGGSIAAVTGALASSMGQMVLNLTIGKEKYKSFESDCRFHLSSLANAQKLMLGLLDEDIAAFSLYSDARKLDKADPQRQARIDEAMDVCVRVPLEISAVALGILEDLNNMKEKSNTYLLSDLGVGAELASATVHAALLNVRANLAYIKDSAKSQGLKEHMANNLTRAQSMLGSIREFLAAKL